MGAPSVNPSWWDYFWSLIYSAEQRKRTRDFLPTEYSSMDLDSEGFIFTTISGGAIIPGTKDSPLKPSRCRCPEKKATRRPWVSADRRLSVRKATSGPSMLVDIAARENGIYSVLCRRRGRVYTYNHSGQLLYVFGGIGQGVGLTQTAAAVAAVGDRLLVLDSGLNRITVFDPTEYAVLIHAATAAYERGDYDGAAQIWGQVLRRNANNELAYIGIGKNYLQKAITSGTDAKDYLTVMDYFKLGNDRKGYSNAFYRYRRAVVGERFSLIMNTLFAAVVLIYLGCKFQGRKRLRSRWRSARVYALVASEPVQNNRIYKFAASTWGSLRYAAHVMFHPFDGFWDLKHERRGSAAAATIILGGVVFTYIFMRQYLGYVFNSKQPETLNIFVEIAGV